MTTKTKAQKEFIRESRDGKYCYVKRMPSGGEVHRDKSEYFAYDSVGKYLGWTDDQTAAEQPRRSTPARLLAFLLDALRSAE